MLTGPCSELPDGWPVPEELLPRRLLCCLAAERWVTGAAHASARLNKTAVFTGHNSGGIFKKSPDALAPAPVWKVLDSAGGCCYNEGALQGQNFGYV
jgi:hypothetical protein